MPFSTNLVVRRGRRARLVVPVVAFLIVGVAGGCTSDRPKAETTTTRSVLAPASETPTGTGTAYGVDGLGLGLHFELSASFAAADDEALVFLARSVDPRAIFSIDAASPDDIKHDAETGETVTPTTLGEVDAVLVLNAAVEGLPTGIAANELVVSNGTQSFSVILSADPADLTELWDPFVASITVDPA